MKWKERFPKKFGEGLCKVHTDQKSTAAGSPWRHLGLVICQSLFFTSDFSTVLDELWNESTSCYTQLSRLWDSMLVSGSGYLRMRTSVEHESRVMTRWLDSFFSLHSVVTRVWLMKFESWLRFELDSSSKVAVTHSMMDGSNSVFRISVMDRTRTLDSALGKSVHIWNFLIWVT